MVFSHLPPIKVIHSCPIDPLFSFLLYLGGKVDNTYTIINKINNKKSCNIYKQLRTLKVTKS